jgi:hypothetical protein
LPQFQAQPKLSGSVKITTFHATRHSQQRSIDREISVQTMKDVEKYPTSQRQRWRGPNGGMGL